MVLFIAYIIRNNELYDIALSFKPLGYKPVDMDKMHMTILFVGDVTSIVRSRIIKALSENIPREVIEKRLRLRVTGLRLLPDNKYTHVAVTVEPNRDLNEIRRLIKDIVYKIVEPRDRFSFLPHITIARRRDPPDRFCLSKAVKLINMVAKSLPKYITAHELVCIETAVGGRYIKFKIA